MVRKRLVLFTLLLLFPCVIFGQQPTLKRIVLNWEFFKNDRPQHVEHEAHTWYRLNYTLKPTGVDGEKITLQFDVTLVMDTANSYFQFNKRKNGAKLLKHEQGHADIGVIYAEKLRNAFAAATFFRKDLQPSVRAIFDKIYTEMTAENLRYDKETNHSKNIYAQKKWDLYFESQLINP